MATAAGGREVVGVTVAVVTAAVDVVIVVDADLVMVEDTDFVTVEDADLTVDVDATALAMLHDLVMPTWHACLPSSSSMAS